MRNLLRRTALALLIALVPALFCALMTAPLSFALPLNCPAGSEVIGIECFDAQYNNTTPWYRRDLNPAFVSFPLWLLVSLVAVWSFSGQRAKGAVDAVWGPSQPEAEPELAVVTATVKADPDADKRWLPTQCPQCGGALAINEVQWISSFEARCPYCGSVLKA